MVQRKVPNKLGINPHLLNPDTHLGNPQTHDLKKIMKKTRPVKRPDPDTLRSSPTLKKKRSPPPSPPLPPNNGAGSATGTPQKPPPNYMKSTSSFEARKEHKIPTPKSSVKFKAHGSRPASLKLVKSPSFKPIRLSKKCAPVILCEDLEAQRATCSSTLKDSKFPNFLELNPGGNELNGTSAMKVCPYTYCSLNGHHHAPAPPLKCFLSARRRAMKTQKSFKLGCLSPRKTYMKENKETDRLVEKESKDFFIEINGKDGEEKGDRDSGCSDIDWEEIDGDVCEERVLKKGDEGLYGGLRELYDEESVSSGAWLESDGDYESDGSYQQMKIDRDEFEEPSTTTKADVNDEMDDDKIEGLTGKTDELPTGDHEIKCSIDHRQEETSRESEASRDKSNKRQTIIYNIIQINILVFINGEKTEGSGTEKGVVKVPAMDFATDKKVSESLEEQITSNEGDDLNSNTAFDEVIDLNQMVNNEELPLDAQDVISNEQLDAGYFAGMEKDSDTDKNHSLRKETTTGEELPDPSIDLIGSTRGKKPDQEMEGSSNFNPRGPNFLVPEPDPDAETVDLRHQMMDERKNAEEWMVDFALQQAVTTLAPARKRKVALLVEAFEKVMPIPKYETHNRYAPKAFTNARPMQACS